MKILKHLSSLIVFIFFIFIAYGSDDDNNSKTEITENEKYDSIDSSTNKIVSQIPLKTRLENNIKSLDSGDDLVKDIKSVDEIVIALAVFKSYHMIITEGEESKNADEKKLVKKLKDKVSNYQIKNFPKLRFAYYKILSDKLWEHDVTVGIGGNKNTILNLTAGYFAANKNIKYTQETLHEMLSNLRFKQINYRWYKGEDEYTYYKIESPKDSEIVD